jgi:quinoprotein glucose dehydrogenase
MQNPAVAEAKTLLAAGFAKRPIAELLKLLAHAHRQVRQEAQFALAGHGGDAIAGLAGVAAKHDNRLARLHALWGLGMIGRQHPDAYTHVAALLSDADLEVRANAARVYGDAPNAVVAKLLPLLTDREPRVQMMACLALARGTGTSDGPAIRTAVFALLKANADKDPVVRHAASEALAKRVAVPLLAAAATDDNAAIRLGCVLALRKRADAHLADFLNDSDSAIVDEAARAINDTPVRDALPALAALSTKNNLSTYTAYRVANAHYLLHTPDNASALANYAARPDGLPDVRALALKMLGAWANPPRRDYITGLTQTLSPQGNEVAVAALQRVLAKVFAGPEIVLKEAVTTSTKLGLKEVGPFLQQIALDMNAPVTARIDALYSLDALKDPKVKETANMASKADNPKLRNAGRALLFKSETPRILGELNDVLKGNNLVEQQGVFALLAANESTETDALLLEWLDRTAAKKVAPELVLDILEAAERSKNPGIRAMLKTINGQRVKADPLANYRETLVGGDAARGRDLFVNKTTVQCQRCHQLDGQGGEVGPPVNGVGKQPRDYLLEAIVLPSKAIAKGYESVSILTYDGKTVSGVLRGEDAKEVRIVTPEGKVVIIKKDNIDERKATKSAMPEDIAPKLTKRELRDLVEFLATLKDDGKKP